MKFPLRVLLTSLIAVFGLSAVTAQDLDLAAKVNGEGISRTLLQNRVDASMRQGSSNYGAITQPSQYKRVQRQVLDQLIVQELLWQAAKGAGFVATADEVEQAMAQVRQGYPTEMAFDNALTEHGFTAESFEEDMRRKIAVRRWAQETLGKDIQVSDAEVHDFYLANQVRFVQSEQINVRHVLIKLASDADEAATAAARGKIEQVLEQARAGADFAELAKTRSEGPSAPQGGELGFVPRGTLVKPFEDAAFALKPGEISDVVRTQYGFHVIKLEARREGSQVPEEQAAPAIRQQLSASKFQDAVLERMRTLRQEASVEILIPES
ncbi:MAG: peptidylprolyl isomerase [Rhodospirillales bacterium]|nr:peptidylprolyl isomerase [Rhodospirillales bacterium]